MKNKKVTIVFVGLSIENTPKIKQVADSLMDLGYSVSIKGIVKNKKIDSAGLYSKGESQGLKKIFHVFFLQLRLMFHLLFKDKAEFYYTINPITSITVSIISGLKRKKYIYESHEMIFGVNYHFFTGKWRYFWTFIDQKLIKNSAYFFTTDEFRLRFYKRYYKLKGQNMGYLLNVPSKVQASDKSTLRKKYGINHKYIISYCGGIIEGRNIEEIIGAYSFIKSNDIHLLLAGSISDSYKKTLMSQIDKLGIKSDQITFTGDLENSILKEYMALSDITFTLYKRNTLNNRLCSPNKIFDAIHVQTYFIATDSPIAHKIITEYPVGNIVNDLTIDNLKNQILQSIRDIEQVNYDNFSVLSSKYNWEVESRKLSAVIKEYID